jgi:hypothetical protein
MNRTIPRGAGKDDRFIQSWLAQTSRQPDWSQKLGQQSGEPSAVTPHYSKKPRKFQPLASPEGPKQPRKCSNGRRRSIDSSIIPTTNRLLDTCSVMFGNLISSDPCEGQEDRSGQSYPTQDTGPIRSSPSVSRIFQKQPRRKTRSDRYESKKRTRNSEREAVNAKWSSRREKKPKARQRLSSCYQIMSNFTSDKIISQHLTVKHLTNQIELYLVLTSI